MDKVYVFTITETHEAELDVRVFRHLESAKTYLRKAFYAEVQEDNCFGCLVESSISADGLDAEVKIDTAFGERIIIYYEIFEQEVIE